MAEKSPFVAPKRTTHKKYFFKGKKQTGKFPKLQNPITFLSLYFTVMQCITKHTNNNKKNNNSNNR